MTKQVKVSDLIAQFLKEKDIKHVFGIIGSANSHIFDSISNLGFTEIICVHHEQAATMAMQTYYRTSGKIGVTLGTCGPGILNFLQGMACSYFDSIPSLYIAGAPVISHLRKNMSERQIGFREIEVMNLVKPITKY